MLQISPILAFDDNYIWCIENEQFAYVVDPGEAAPVIDYLEKKQLSLRGILITHHHADHIGGIKSLKAWQQAQGQPEFDIFTPNTARFPFATVSLNEGDLVELESVAFQLQVMEVPGHTKDHIAFVNNDALFCGDTLFSAGCGRLFEGNAEQMQANFERFNALPESTQIYCAHEYTRANVDFALAVWPENTDINDYSEWVNQQRAQGIPTLPGSIGQEKKINPFMNADSIELKKNVEQHFNSTYTSPVDVFSALRSWKDNF